MYPPPKWITTSRRVSPPIRGELGLTGAELPRTGVSGIFETLPLLGS
jgi:hypothetical protein